MKNRIMTFVLMAGSLTGTGSVATAHEIFQDTMKEIYTLKSFSCKSCHPDNDDRKKRTMFAELIYQQLKDKSLSEKWAEVEPQGKAAIAEFENSIVKDFKKAMKVVGQKQLTIDQIIEAGMFNGARLDEDKIAEMEAAQEKVDPPALPRQVAEP